MDIAILALPYHLDREHWGTGAGPERLLAEGVVPTLTEAGHAPRAVESVRLDHDFGNETGNIFENARGLAKLVRAARDSGAVPLVLAGDCNNAIGVVSGLSDGNGDLGLVWLDAHGDSHTPETSGSGFFDGMPLAVVLGWCWRTLAASVPGFQSLAPEDVVHLGGRAFDEGEREPMDASGMTVIDADTMRSASGTQLTADALDRLLRTKRRIHVHLDLDVIDRADGVVSEHGMEGGPSIEAIETVLRTLGESGRVASATICSYDPAFDINGRAARVGLRLLATLARALRGSEERGPAES